ncbi:MAG: galactokinase [Chloroflexi bacterium]|nr:MAG: galactokinase [Chloroflexota bacterium]
MSARGSAHGRVNLVGEHTDYNGGLVLPTVIPQQTEMVVERQSDRLIRLRTEARGMAPVEVPLDAIAPRRDWSDHVLGVVDTLRRRGHDLGGFAAEVRSTVPLGAGLSSSAALGVATVRGLREAFALRIDDRDVALIAHESEDQFVGAHVGLMDQLVCSLGREGEALRIDLRDRSTRHIALDRIDMEIAVIDSGIRHQHAAGDYQKGRDSGPSSTGRATPGSYNVRRRECEDAARALGVHVLSENARVDAAVDAIERSDAPTLGDVLKASHASLRDDFEVSLPVIDDIVAAAQRESDFHGARLVGGGFGGSVLVLTRRGAARAVAERIASRSGSLKVVLPAAPR